MALPQSGEISFSDLNSDMGNSTTAQLDISTAASYYGLSAPHSMDEFYSTPLPYFGLAGGESTAEAAYTNNQVNGNYYHNGTGSYPDNFDTVYVDDSGTTPYNGGNLWYKITSTDFVLKIGSNGLVMSKYDMSQTLSVSPTSTTKASTANSFTANVTSNSTWNVSEGLSWVSYSGASGSGNDAFTVSLTENTGTQRSGTITIQTLDSAKTATISITQSAAAGTTYPHQLGTSSTSTGSCVAGQSTYYTDQPNYGASTKIWTDSAGLNYAAGGYYSDGSTWLNWDGRSKTVTDVGFCGF